MMRFFITLLVGCVWTLQLPAQTVTKSEPKNLDNGMTIVSYELHKTLEFPEDVSYCNAEFDYHIEWPVSGPEPLTDIVRRYILKEFKITKDIPADFSLFNLSNVMLQRFKDYSSYYDDGMYEGPSVDNLNISIMATNKTTTILKGGEEKVCGQNSIGFFNDTEVYLNSGQKLSYDIFPSYTQIKPLIWKYLENFDEKVDNPDDEVEYEPRLLSYPDNDPIIGNDFITFDWGIQNRESCYSATIPLSEFLPFATPELRKYLPIRNSGTSNINAADNGANNYINPESETTGEYEEKIYEDEKIYSDSLDQQAEFPGGASKCMQWLSQNIRYPEAAVQNDIQGRVVVKFIVEKDGSIRNAQIVKGVDKDLDREALRIISKMPKWIPGKMNGIPVRSYFNFPMTFKLQNQ